MRLVLAFVRSGDGWEEWGFDLARVVIWGLRDGVAKDGA
jgi:hypothetical protein